MTKEDIMLLMVDLSGRLPYNVKCKVKYVVNNESTDGKDIEMERTDVIKRINLDNLSVYTENLGTESDIEDIRPYLRPLSSMTEKEEDEFKEILELSLKALEEPEGHTICSAASSAFEIDFYNRHHFDYRGLIEKGLALAVKESNPYK